MFDAAKYDAFLKAKVKLASSTGFEIEDGEINPALKPHNKLMVKWMVEGGRRACFAAFGLHKTVTQLETVRITLTKTGGRGLIICPLGVKQEFVRDALNILGWEIAPKFIRRIEEAEWHWNNTNQPIGTGIYLTNYESVRDGKLDPRLFNVASLDEASVLRGFGGTKTFREFMRLFTGDAGPNTQGKDRRNGQFVPYRFVATATPSPNDYIELLAYADFLGIMDISGAKTRFFKRDSTQADKLTIHPHKEEEFWLWVASWALFVQKPSDITGNAEDDKGYILPDVDIRWHELPSDHSTAGADRNGQFQMYRDVAIGLTGASKEKRDSLDARVAKLMELRAEDPSAHRLIWHDTEIERAALKRNIPSIVTVQGKDTDKHKEESIIGFSDGEFQELGGKPCMLGSGTNFQRHCWWAIYLGIGFKFNDFIQSFHRIIRFGQIHRGRIDLIYTEAERGVRKVHERKWNQHKEQVKIMTDINQKYGLSKVAMAQLLNRKMGVERVEVQGRNYRLANNDNVLETARMETNSVGLIVTSWPFSTQYEYSPNYADFGHSDNNDHFFQQMDFLTPETFRVLKPGRDYVLHVKDRIVPGGMTGLGFQTVYPFHMHCLSHMVRHGFAFLGMKTIVTDVVRENKQTNRLGWTEQCRDGSRMGAGMCEYILLFRKPQTDNTKGYADERVVKNKPLQIVNKTVTWHKCPICQNELELNHFVKVAEDNDWLFNCPTCKQEVISTEMQPGEYTQPFNRDQNLPLVPQSGYSRSRWQIDAHGLMRSSGDRLFTPDELKTLDHDEIFKIFRKYSLENIYDFEHHVRIGEELEGVGRMPTTFMLLQPQSWNDDVWTDITRMRTLNAAQWSQGKEMHVCPMQLDLAKRVIAQMSNPGDTVYDPFAGIGTVPYVAVQLGRVGVGAELSPEYFTDAASYCKAAEQKADIPTLFDTLENAA